MLEHSRAAMAGGNYRQFVPGVRRLLQPGQILHNLLLTPIHRSNELAEDHAVAVDDVGLWHLDRAIALRNRSQDAFIGPLACLTDSEQVDAMVLQELVIIIGVVIDTYRQYHYVFPLCVHSLLQFDQGRHLFDAWRTPGGPEIQNYNLSAILAEADAMVGVLNRKIRRDFPDFGRFRALVTAGCAEGCNTGKNESGNAHLNIINALELRGRLKGSAKMSLWSDKGHCLAIIAST
jgi:hypothetical protein